MIPETNVKPKADAGNSQYAKSGDVITLDGSASYDDNGDSLTYSWSQIDTTGYTATLSSPTSATTTVTLPDVLVYSELKFELTVTEQNTSELYSDDDSLRVYLSPLSTSRDADWTIDNPNPSSYNRFGTNLDALGNNDYFVVSGYTTWISDYEPNSEPNADSEPSGTYGVDVEITGNSVTINGAQYDLADTVTLGSEQETDEVFYEPSLPDSVVLVLDDESETAYIVDSESQVLAFKEYNGYVYLFDVDNQTPEITTKGATWWYSDYGEDDITIFDSDSLATSDPKYYTADDMWNVGLGYVYDNVSGNLASETGYIQNPENERNDYFGKNLEAVGNDKIVFSGNLANVYLFSINGTLLNTYSNPDGTTSIYPTAIESFGDDKFVVSDSPYTYVYSTTSTIPLLTINGSSSFIATNTDKNWILIGSNLYDGSNGSMLMSFSVSSIISSVDFIKNKVIFGADGNSPNGISGAGSAYIYSTYDGSLLETLDHDGQSEDFGTAIASVKNGEYFIVSASEYKDGTIWDSGRLYVYSNINNNPIANANSDKYSVNSGTVVTLNGTASFDIDMDNLTYSWTQTDSSGATVTLSDSTSATPTFTAPTLTTDTIIEFILSVSDGSLSDSATIEISIIATDTIPPTITAPLDQTFEATAIDTPLTFTDYGTATATDDTDSSSNITITSDAPATFPLGNTTITWTATDSSNNSDTATQTVTILDTTIPVITAPAAFSTEATAVDTPLTSADYGLAAGVDIFSPVAITSDAPATFPLGNTTITWTATDANGLIATAQQTVTIVNAPPVGVSDVYTIDEDNILTVSDYASGVLGNDIDPNNPIIASADLVSDTVNGILLLNPDGTFEYDPDDDFFGTDTFTYIPNDGFLVGSETSVTINVQPINDVPVAGDSTVATDLNAGVEILLTGSDIDGDVLGLNLVSLPSNGAITEIIEVSSNSISLKYTPNIGFIGIDSFDYAFTDAESQSNTATVTVLVAQVVPPAEDNLQTEKSDIITSIEEISTDDLDSRVIKKLDKAIKHVEKSVSDELWQDDGMHLDDKFGKKVFSQEAKAAKKLMQILKQVDQASSSEYDDETDDEGDDNDSDNTVHLLAMNQGFKDSVQTIIDDMVDLDSRFAEISVNEANAVLSILESDPNTSDNLLKKIQKQIDRMNKELQKAQEKLDEDKYDKSILHYKKAWSAAEKAIKIGT